MPTLPPIRVSAIVSTYAGEKFLRGCLQDLVSQTLFQKHQLEILIIDAASPQKEAAIAAEFTTLHPSLIRYHRTPTRLPLYAAWNLAIPLATAPYLSNANVDDRHHPTCLELLADALDSNPQHALAYPDSLVTTSPNLPFHLAPITSQLLWPDFSRDALFQSCFVGPHPLWRKSLHQTFGLFDESLTSAGDYEFWLRLAAANQTFLHLPQPLSLYLENPASISLSNIDLNWTESEIARDRHWNPVWGLHPKFRPALPHFENLATRIPPNSRIALYGSGKHTQKFLPLFQKIAQSRNATIIAILDDAPKSSHLQSIPIHPLAAAPTLALTAIIPSSDTHEPAMLKKLHHEFPQTMSILPLYTAH